MDSHTLTLTMIMISYRVVFVMMFISSIAFYAMAFRVPVVSSSWSFV